MKCGATEVGVQLPQHPDYPWTLSGTHAVSGALPCCWFEVGTPGQGDPPSAANCTSPPAHLHPVPQDPVHLFPASRTGVSLTWDFRTLCTPSGHTPRPGASWPCAHPLPAVQGPKSASFQVPRHGTSEPMCTQWPCSRLSVIGTPFASILFLHWHPVGLVTKRLVTMPDPHMKQAPQGPCVPRPRAPGYCTQAR